MPSFIGSSKSVLLAVVFLLLALVAACAGPAGAVGPPGPAGPTGPAGTGSGAAIIVTPNPVETSAKTVTVAGSGFTPKEKVFIGLAGIYDSDKLALAMETANDFGAFTASIAMSSITALKQWGPGKIEVGPGVYSIRARGGDSGAVATAPLNIVAPAKK